MDSESQVRQLEAALLEQAESLAREQRTAAVSARERVLADSAERLKIAEEREILSAKIEAERLVRRQTQSAETRLAAELDRLRWALTDHAGPGTAGLPGTDDRCRALPAGAGKLAGRRSAATAAG